MGTKFDGGEARQLPVEAALRGPGTCKDDNVIVVGVCHGLSSGPVVLRPRLSRGGLSGTRLGKALFRKTCPGPWSAFALMPAATVLAIPDDLG
ncbi:hypothetical protein NicSoilE8_28710 [Arthrobacter sp. NicSoilE8]|nr:hypothetical protein NicSoilE8_28710 [Arthrobacter sp. NicSoilE8]